MEATASLTERRQAIRAAISALKGLHRVLWQSPSDDLGPLLADLDELTALGWGQMIAVTTDADQRGTIGRSTLGTTTAWVADNAWHTKTTSAGTIAKASKLLTRRDLETLHDAILTADVTPAQANTIAAEYDKLADQLTHGATDTVIGAMIDMAAEHGTTMVRRMRQELIANYGDEGAFDDEQTACKKAISLSAGVDRGGVFHYDLELDAEGRATLEAAIGPLAKPRPDPDTGERDERSTERRRGDALVEMLRRGVAAAPGVPTSPKAVLMVTMRLQDLRDQVGAGTVQGSRDEGALLAPSAVRKLACDAGIIPVILGSDSEILDQGRETRTYTHGQRAALRLRDRHCTYPDCTIPANWCNAHHLQHWADGGETNLNHGALLCDRHHTIVHRDLMHGEVIAGQVVWDLTPGSYQPPQQQTHTA